MWLVTQAGTATVAAWTKAGGRRSVVTQTVAPREQVGVQAPGCRECQSLSLAKVTCVCCKQVNDVLSLVAEVKEEVERLSVRGRQTEGATLHFCLKWSQPAQGAKDAEGFPSSL